MFIQIFRLNKSFNFDVFVIYDAYLPLTSLAVKLLKRKLLLVIGSSLFKEEIARGHRLFACLCYLSTIFAYFMSNVLTVFGKHMIYWVNADKFKYKIKYVSQPIGYILSEYFYFKKQYKDRKNIVGFVAVSYTHLKLPTN